MPDEPPYSGLTPDTVLDALATAGFAGDGRLLGLNSYENRVYQVWLEAEEKPDSPASVVAKFYRPARWTDAQILEEHAFTLELLEREIPVVAPLAAKGVEKFDPMFRGKKTEVREPAVLLRGETEDALERDRVIDNRR